MNRKKILLPVVIGIVALGILLLRSFLFIVFETNQAIVLRFGDPLRTHAEAGLYVKLPIDEVILLDRRNLELDVDPPVEILARNQETLKVDAFVRYRITDPLLFYQSFKTGTANAQLVRQRAELAVSSVLENALRGALGQVGLEDIITRERANLMAQIGEAMAIEATKFGVQIIDIKIRRADLPETNAEKVFSRMRSERQEVAQKIRSEGERDARIIRAQADKNVVEIVAGAQEEAEKIKGEADSRVTGIFADVHGVNPEFYSFYKSLEVYGEALVKEEKSGEKPHVVLTTGSPFLRYLDQRDPRERR